MYGPENFAHDFDVSRETLDKFRLYEEQLAKWQKKINLVAPSTLQQVWLRHFADSAQLAPFLDKSQHIADMGAGAGFPGLVLSILGFNVTLIESDSRKCAFLKNMVRQLQLDCHVKNQRIEDMQETYDVVTARALASLTNLFELCLPLADHFVFLKGENWQAELKDLQGFRFEHQTAQSLSAENAKILIFENVSRET